MVSITLSVTDDFKKELTNLNWVNWSEIAREEIRKKLIFEKYLKSKSISDSDWKFCESIDWHPVDELPIKKEYIRKLSEKKKGKFIKFNSVEELFK